MPVPGLQWLAQGWAHDRGGCHQRDAQDFARDKDSLGTSKAVGS